MAGAAPGGAVVVSVLAWAKQIVDARAERTVALIRTAIATKGKVTTSARQ